MQLGMDWGLLDGIHFAVEVPGVGVKMLHLSSPSWRFAWLTAQGCHVGDETPCGASYF